MIIATIFFVFISLTILLGITNPTLRQGTIIADMGRSRESFFLAEAGVEDVVYRLKNRINVSSGDQTLTLNGRIATTNLSDSAGSKVITSISDWDGRVRKVETRLNAGVGVSFNYGVQVGNGGFALSNNAGVVGNVYSNGSITGGNGSYITGSAYAANSLSLTTDQSNVAPTPPPNTITFRQSSATQDVAQKFQVSASAPVNKAEFYIRKQGSPSNATVRIVSDNNGNPGSSSITTGTLTASQVTTSFSLVTVVFTSNPLLTAGNNYWIVIDSSSNSSSNYYIIGANNSYAQGDAKIGQQGSTWNATNPSPLDLYFSVSTGGINGSISGVDVGQNSIGDAWANIVNNVDVAGNLYCKSGSGNNKACDTSQPDPVAQPFPISEGNIMQWKSEAESGSTIEGDYTINDTTAILGPVKINGNLTVTNNTTLTINGTVWVTGNISITNNVVIRMSAGYGDASAAVVTDGRISLSNNVEFYGSGTQGSYIMLLSTSDCPVSPSCGGSDAITIGNNVGAVILNAQKGTISFSNNASAKEAVGNKISLSNNAVISYETGLANVNFASGPSGGWDIVSWKEVE